MATTTRPHSDGGSGAPSGRVAAPRRGAPFTRSVAGVVFAPAVVVVVAAACGGRAPDPADGAAGIELVEVARLDGGASSGGAGFGAISDLEIGAADRIYVLDRLNRVVHAFGAAGDAAGVFGGRGGGPGELEHPTALFPGREGDLWVVDSRNARYTVFDATGALLGTYRSADGHVFDPLAVGYSRDGPLYTVTLEFGRLERPAAVLVESELRDGEVRTLRQLELPFVSWPEPFVLAADGMMLVAPVPFTAEPSFQIGADGALWYAADGPFVHRWTPRAGIERSYGGDFAAPRLSAAERHAALEDRDFEELRAAAGPAGMAELAGRIPAMKPHLRGFFVADDGSVWLMRTPSGADATPRIDVYDAAGAPLGVVRLPLEAEPRPRVRGGLLAGVVRDELGVESVVVYRIGAAP